jgi:hypothetical protein
MRATRRREEEMIGTDRTGSRAGRSSTARRRPAVASLLLAFALMTGACGGAKQEASDATASVDPNGAGQTLSIVDVGSGTETAFTAPDGAWIAFNSYHHPEVRLILANSDGSKRRIIARLGSDDGYQRWSPDSTQIAFIGSVKEDGFGTYVYDLATGETRFVTTGTIESWIDDDHILVS